MSTLPRREYSVYITIALALAGGMVAVLVLITASRASGVELTSARLVPEDAALYVAVNTELSSNQWLTAFKLAERLGQARPLQRLKEAAEDEGGLDWDDDVAPFLGGNAAIYVRSFDASSFDLQGAVIIRGSDPEEALNVVRRESGLDFERGVRSGVTYYAEEFSGVYLAVIDGHLVIGMNRESLFEVIDVHAGKTLPLADRASFRELRDRLASDFLAFVYVDGRGAFEGLLGADPAIERLLGRSGAAEAAFQPMAFALSARGDSFAVQSSAEGSTGPLSPLLGLRVPRLVALVPAEAAIFVDTANIAAAWKAGVLFARNEIDDLIARETQYRDLDDLLDRAGAETGIGSIGELVGILDGETALAAWFPGGRSGEPELLLLADVHDEARARPLLERALAGASDGAPPRKETAGGAEVAIYRDRDGQEVALAIHSPIGRMTVAYVGTPGAVRLALGRDAGRPPLTSLPAYRDAVDQLPSPLGSYVFIDVGRLIDLAPRDSMPPELRRAFRGIDALLLNAVTLDRETRTSGVLTVKE